jgi:hypothetical protein
MMVMMIMMAMMINCFIDGREEPYPVVSCLMQLNSNEYTKIKLYVYMRLNIVSMGVSRYTCCRNQGYGTTRDFREITVELC